MTIIGYKHSVTGAFSHLFYRDGVRVCEARAHVLPIQPVYITGEWGEWFSRFDMDSTLYPGLTRSVTVSESGEEAFRLVYLDRGSFTIQLGERTICVWSVADIHRFFEDGAEVAAIENVADTAAALPPRPPALDRDATPLYVARLSDALPPTLQGAILAYPMLRFAL